MAPLSVTFSDFQGHICSLIPFYLTYLRNYYHKHKHKSWRTRTSTSPSTQTASLSPSPSTSPSPSPSTWLSSPSTSPSTKFLCLSTVQIQVQVQALTSLFISYPYFSSIYVILVTNNWLFLSIYFTLSLESIPCFSSSTSSQFLYLRLTSTYTCYNIVFLFWFNNPRL